MSLQINNIYSQKDIARELNCTIMRGMNFKIDTNRLILIRNHVKSIYEDKQVDDILYYTGEGRIGDQTLTGANGRLFESKNNDIEIVLFEVFKSKEYTYKGLVQLFEEPFQEMQLDETNTLRSVYVFPLKILNKLALINDDELIKNNNVKKEQRAKKLSEEELYQKTKQSEQKDPGYSYTKTRVYQRSEYVVESVLRRSNGICELCANEALFIKKDGNPYLEVHHIEQLSKGGSDTTDNAVALCPNCHRKIHSLELKTDIIKLKKSIKYL